MNALITSAVPTSFHLVLKAPAVAEVDKVVVVVVPLSAAVVERLSMVVAVLRWQATVVEATAAPLTRLFFMTTSRVRTMVPLF